MTINRIEVKNFKYLVLFTKERWLQERFSIYIPPSANPLLLNPLNLINKISNLYSRNSIVGRDLNGYHPAWDRAHYYHRSNLICYDISSVNLSIRNTGIFIRLDCPPSPNSAVDISIFFSNLFFSLLWTVLDLLRGSDHFSIIIKHVRLFLISSAFSPHIYKTFYKLNFHNQLFGPFILSFLIFSSNFMY